MPELSKAQITKDVTPKYKDFSILQNNIEDVVKKSTQIWKLTYGLTITKKGREEPIEVKDDEVDDEKD